MAVSCVSEELLQEIAYQPGLDAVEIVLAIAAKTDEPGHAKERQMVAYRRLRLIEQVAQGGHMQLPVLRQGEQDLQPGFVREQFEDLSETINRPAGNLERGRRPVGEFPPPGFSDDGRGSIHGSNLLRTIHTCYPSQTHPSGCVRL